jgi:hypothetical protein
MRTVGLLLLWLMFPVVMLFVTVLGWCRDRED